MPTPTQRGQNFPLRLHRRLDEIAFPQCGQNWASDFTGAKQFGQISAFAWRTCVALTIPPVIREIIDRLAGRSTMNSPDLSNHAGDAPPAA
jgi:hypothetical protein